ncbi:MAG TPA: alpha/beta fold hydrolase [Acidimicrobiales bacterium]|nr:alpha/beta fold hydrolase [Acidimicrobiales bacterium]
MTSVWLAPALAGAWIVFGLGFVLGTTKKTNRKLLKVWPLRRAARAYRAAVLRNLAWWLSWPHVVDRIVGTARTKVGRTPADVVWRDGPVTLIRYRGQPSHREPVLLVHSLMTKPAILDLLPDRSLVGWLLSQGFDVFLLDFGQPGHAQSRWGLDAYAQQYAAAEAAVLAASGASRVHTIGYCLGATVVLHGFAAEIPVRAASLALIAPPIDFAVPGGMRSILGNRTLRPVLALDGSSLVPAAFVREAFHLMRPQALRTVWRRLTKRGDQEDKVLYGAMSRWAWEHRPLSGAVLFDLVDLNRTNDLLPALRGRIEVPTLVAIAERDHIVPAGSSHALSSVAEVEVLAAAAGHVSMLVGSAARHSLWPGLADWLARQQSSIEGPPDVAPRPRRVRGRA